MSDTIPVRPDERLDEAKLAAYLRSHLPDADAPLVVEQFGGGAANLTYLLRFGEQEYVLRRPPLGPVAPKAHDMEREFKVLSRLYSAFPYAPRAYHLCTDNAILGAPFFIMERRRGLVVRRDLPAEYAHLPNAAHDLSRTLVERLADFHAVDYAALGLADLGKPQGFLARQVTGWRERWEKAKPAPSEAMDKVYAWLEARLPAENAPSLLHNDYKLDNAMFSPQDPRQMVAIFDWDMCTLGDPLVDLGTLLAYWTESGDPVYYKGLLGMPPAELGFLRRADLVQAYAERSGRDVSQIRFYHVLALYRVVVIVAQIYIRYQRGQTQDARFATFGEVIPRLAEAAYALTGSDGV
jgi:aminoglycoside phosphotransferase (APT) family kinase protein